MAVPDPVQNATITIFVRVSGQKALNDLQESDFQIVPINPESCDGGFTVSVLVMSGKQYLITVVSST